MQKIRKQELSLRLLVVLTGLLLACSVTRRAAVPSPIGLLPLEDYRYTGGNVAADTTFRVFETETLFNENFSAVNEQARRPGFSGQSVVAIVLKTAPAVPLQFAKAEIAGKTINVYAQTCAGCNSHRAVLATIPKAGSARSVLFFINGESRARIDL